MVGLIISLITIGLIAGALARLLVPGKQDISIPMTILLGISGSFLGGFPGRSPRRSSADQRPAAGSGRARTRGVTHPSPT
jgi:hypothetical protein